MVRYETMTAKEMFKELNYNYRTLKFINGIEYSRICGESDWEIIIFLLIEKKVRVMASWEDVDIDIPTLKAIYKQCEELGWLE